MKKLRFILSISLITMSFLFAEKSFSQLKSYKFEQIDSLQNVQKRNIIVFIHTDWCKFCEAMKNTTFKNKEVIAKLNNNFYFIDLNAEQLEPIVFDNKKYRFRPSGNKTGVHELAISLGTINGLINYPTLCILNENYEILYRKSTFLSAKDLIKLLQR